MILILHPFKHNHQQNLCQKAPHETVEAASEVHDVYLKNLMPIGVMASTCKHNIHIYFSICIYILYIYYLYVHIIACYRYI